MYAIFRRCLAVSLLAAVLCGCATSAGYEAVAVGDSREHVLAVLGSPSVPERDFTHNEREVVRGTLATMDKNGSESLSVWKQSNELFYIVGFDKNGVVTEKRKFIYVAP